MSFSFDCNSLKQNSQSKSAMDLVLFCRESYQLKALGNNKNSETHALYVPHAWLQKNTDASILFN